HRIGCQRNPLDEHEVGAEECQLLFQRAPRPREHALLDGVLDQAATRTGRKRRTRKRPPAAIPSAAARRSRRVTKGTIFAPPMRSPSRAIEPGGFTYTARSSISLSRASSAAS